MNIWHIAQREVRIGFRNPWAYTFMALFALFNLALLLIQSQISLSGFTSHTAAMLNLILYLLPLMTMLLGSFSLTSEKEEGSWMLLSTYPISTFSFIAGKYAGLVVVLFTITMFGYGLSGVVGALSGNGAAWDAFALFAVFSACLIVLFLALALGIGTLANNRWQALTYGVGIWFFAIIGWPSLLVAILGYVPYLWIKPALIFLTFLNPAELVRLFVIVKLGGGSALGPEYYEWVQGTEGAEGTLLFALLCIAYIGIAITGAYTVWERRRYRHGAGA